MDKLEWRYFSAGRTISYSDSKTRKEHRTYSDLLVTPADEMLAVFPEKISAAFETVDPNLANIVKNAARKPRQIGPLTRFVVRVATAFPSKQLWGRRRNMFLVALASLVGSYYKGVLNSLEKSGGLFNLSPEKLAFYMTRQFLSMIISNYITIALARMSSEEEEVADADEFEQGLEMEEEGGFGVNGQPRGSSAGVWNRLRVILMLDKLFPGIRSYRRMLNEFFKYHIYRDMKRVNRQMYLIGEAVYNALLTALTKLIVEGVAETLDYAPQEERQAAGFSRTRQYSKEGEDEEELEEDSYSDEGEDEDEDEDEVKEKSKLLDSEEEDLEEEEKNESDVEDEDEEADKEFSRLFSKVRPSPKAKYYARLFAREVSRRRIPERRIFSYLKGFLLDNFAKYFNSEEEAEQVADDVVVVLEKAKALELVEDVQELAQKATQLLFEEATITQNEEKMTVDTSEYEEDYGFEDEEQESEETEGKEEQAEESEEEEEKSESRRPSKRHKRHSAIRRRRYSDSYEGDEYWREEDMIGEDYLDDEYPEEGYEDEYVGEGFEDEYVEEDFEDEYVEEGSDELDELEKEIFEEDELDGDFEEQYDDELYYSKRKKKAMKHYKSRRG